MFCIFQFQKEERPMTACIIKFSLNNLNVFPKILSN